jgi:hypothetical protein
MLIWRFKEDARLSGTVAWYEQFYLSPLQPVKKSLLHDLGNRLGRSGRKNK